MVGQGALMRTRWQAALFAVFTMQSSNTLKAAATAAREEADDGTTLKPWLLKAQSRTMAYWGVILAVFTLEIALKVLLMQESQKPRNTHDLTKLFEDLNPDTRQRLTNAIPDLRTTFDQHRHAFEKMRYPYESSDGHPPMFTLEDREVLYAVSEKVIGFAMKGADTGAFDFASLFDPGTLQ